MMHAHTAECPALLTLATTRAEVINGSTTAATTLSLSLRVAGWLNTAAIEGARGRGGRGGVVETSRVAAESQSANTRQRDAPSPTVWS